MTYDLPLYISQNLDGQMNLVNEQRLEAHTSGIGGSSWKADEGADVRETSLGSYRDDTGGDLEDEDRQGCRNLSFPALLCSPDSLFGSKCWR